MASACCRKLSWRGRSHSLGLFAPPSLFPLLQNHFFLLLLTFPTLKIYTPIIEHPTLFISLSVSFRPTLHNKHRIILLLFTTRFAYDRSVFIFLMKLHLIHSCHHKYPTCHIHTLFSLPTCQGFSMSMATPCIQGSER